MTYTKAKSCFKDLKNGKEEKRECYMLQWVWSHTHKKCSKEGDGQQQVH